MQAQMTGANHVHGFRYQIATATAEAQTTGTGRLTTRTTHARTKPEPALFTHDIRNLFLATVGGFTLHQPDPENGRIRTEVGLPLPNRGASRIPRRTHIF